MKNANHDYALAANSLVYPTHKHSTQTYQIASGIAQSHRKAILSYSASIRVLAHAKLGLTITSKEYYNLLRYSRADKSDNISIQAMLIILEKKDFIYRTCSEMRVNADSKNINKQLK